MKPYLITAMFFCIAISAANAQNKYTIRGSVEDTTTHTKLVNTTVTVINAKDSILQKFTRVNAAGNFIINNLNKGKYILLASYPGYADYEAHFIVDSVYKDHDFGRLGMILKSNQLKGVTIKGEVQAMKIKGDTTEFDAKAFKIDPNDKVEDLLKKFPGLQISPSGKITFQGKDYGNVLIDGEEFFGDDPTLVTRNIRADMIDKAQFYDKKSDQAKFSGVDDGVRTPTINLTLKANKKNGYFGKVEATLSTHKYYSEQAMYNNFNGKRKFAVYGNLSNTGQVGLSSSDNQSYTGSYRDDFNTNNDGKYNGVGIPTARSAGSHFDDKWDKDKQYVNTNYRVNYLDVDGVSNNINKNTINKTIFSNNSDRTFHSHSFKQRFDGSYQLTLDTTSSIKITFDGSLSNGNNKTTGFTTSKQKDSLSINPFLQNTSDSRSFNTNNQKQLNGSLFYQKKFKARRTMSVSVNESYSQNNTVNMANSLTKYYASTDSITPVKLDTIDQKKINNNQNFNFSSTISYNEPITKNLIMSLRYSLSVNNSTSERASYNRNEPFSLIPGPLNEYIKRVDSLSNDFKVNSVSNGGGLYFNYSKKQVYVNAGSNITHVNFKQVDEFKTTDNVFTQRYTSISPNASFQYIPKGGYLSLNYNGYQQQPGIYQLQPVKDNNPLFQRIGNQSLKPSFTNRFEFNYSINKVISQQSLRFNANYSTTANQMIDSTSMDTLGKSTSRSVNLRNHSPITFGSGIYFSRQIKKIDVQATISGNLNGNTYYSYDNVTKAGEQPQLNRTSNYTYFVKLAIYKSANKFDFGLNGGPNYTVSHTSLKTLNNSGSGFDGNWWLNLKFPGNVGLGTWGFYNFKGKTEAFDTDYSQTIANAYINKKFLKAQNLRLSIFAIDIFNQNNGFSRSNNGTSLSQSRSTAIGRYFTLDLTWDFNAMGGSTAKNKK